MKFATGTTIPDAKAEVLAWLPRETTTAYYPIDHTSGSCVLWNLRSLTLARELGIRKIGGPQGDLGTTQAARSTVKLVSTTASPPLIWRWRHARTVSLTGAMRAASAGRKG